MTKANTKLTDEEVEERKGERKYGDIDLVLGRRKNGRTMEYECTFVGQVTDFSNLFCFALLFHSLFKVVFLL